MSREKEAGVGPHPQHLLSVTSRETGLPQTASVPVLTYDGKRYLVAGNPDLAWVRNVRAAGKATLTSGRRNERVLLAEVPAEQRHQIVKVFAGHIRGAHLFLRGDHPVFLIEPETR